jgi:hypothetical protein
VDRDAIERTSEEVRRILEAAEASAAQIRGRAAEDAARLERAALNLRARLDEALARFHEEAAGEPASAAPEPAAPLDGDEAGARLTALNMALGGTPREETARYLAEHYALADPEALLDDVYERAGG